MIVREKKPRKSKAGRKWFDGKNEDEIVSKLTEAAAIDADVKEMCYYADISRESYYRYLEAHPVLRDRIEALREKPVMLARQTVVKSLHDPNHAFRYLEKKRKKEFGNAIDLTSGGEKLPVPIYGGTSTPVPGHDCD